MVHTKSSFKIKKMSKITPLKLRIYKTDEINKKIIRKSPRKHTEFDYVGSNNKYRDNDYEIYKKKKKEFYEAAKQYQELNKAVFSHNKTKLDQSTDGICNYIPECQCDFISRKLRCSEDEPNKTGLRIKRRSERQIHTENLKQFEVCYLEPWFKKYLILCKFIEAARKIILKNRLLKVLQILNDLDEDTIDQYELGHRKCENVSYADIFEKFII